MRTRDMLKKLRHEKYMVNYAHAFEQAEIKSELMATDKGLEKQLQAIDEVNRCRDLYVMALADLIVTLVGGE